MMAILYDCTDLPEFHGLRRLEVLQDVHHESQRPFRTKVPIKNNSKRKETLFVSVRALNSEPIDEPTSWPISS